MENNNQNQQNIEVENAPLTENAPVVELLTTDALPTGGVDDSFSVANSDGATVAPPQNVHKERWNKVVNVLLWVAIALLVALLFVRTFVATNVTVSGDSMLQTYHDGDKVMVNKLGKIERGDVAVFFKKDVDSKFLANFSLASDGKEGGKYEKLIKRVVAVEGDKLWVEQIDATTYKLVVQTPNGDLLNEDYYTLKGKKLSPFVIKTDNVLSGLGRLQGTSQQNPLVVSDGCFFAIGDNRANSSDSRGDLGEVPTSRLFGVVFN